MTRRRRLLRGVDYLPGICSGIDEILLGALIGAGTTAGVDAATGQPVTWGGELAGAGLGAAGAGVAGALGGGAAGADTGALSAADVGSGAAGGLSSGAIDASIQGGATLLPESALSGGEAAAASSALPEITVSAAPLAAGGSSLPGVAGGLAGGLGAGIAAGASGAPASTGQAVTDQASTPSDSSTPGILAATSPSDITSVSPDTLSMLGIDSGGGGVGTVTAGAGDAGTVFDPSITGEDPSMMDALTTTSGGDTSLAPTNSQALVNWFKNPKNLATAGLLGVSGLNALSKPKLPGAARTALGAAGPAVAQATSTIQTGGTGSPLWPGMKASIDSSIDQQIKQQTEALMQAAANAGMQGPGAPTGVVAQQIARMTSDLNVQRQQLYEQALNQIVNQAVQELTGGNQTLMAVANEQLALEQQARNSAAQTAELALQLQQLSFG